MAGASAQLAVNLAGMVFAGAVTLLVQRVLWRRAGLRIHVAGRGQVTRR
jgi:hypothetical protein